MRQEIKWFVTIFVLGASLVAYANANFVTRDMFALVYDEVKSIKSEMSEIKRILIKRND